MRFIVVSALAAGIVLGLFSSESFAAEPLRAEDFQAINKRLTDLERRVSALESKSVGVTPSPSPFPPTGPVQPQVFNTTPFQVSPYAANGVFASDGSFVGDSSGACANGQCGTTGFGARGGPVRRLFGRCK